nr:MAG: YqzL family protein [Bacillota bacterium]
MLTADFFWNIFEATGSITAYLIYRKLISGKLYPAKKY